ncbi:MAG: restriction endonuclease subunit S [Algoriphagus aquaeductus]|uniref:restriction endonuclease subunit S n=1 Tax=Algoriphagus aquaeductus TaxID=475299 RepID=UPI003918AF26
MSENRKVPKLRFPGFDKEWSESTLGDQTSWKSGGTPSKDVGEYWNGDIPWISASSMRGTKFSSSELMVTESGSKNGTRIAPKGSLLLLVRGSMLFNKIPVGIAERNVTFNQDVKAITPDGSTTSDFLLQWFLKSERNILGIVGGTGIGAGKLDTKELQSLTYSFPSLPEQQKIAEFLTAVDRRIELLQAKKEKLEAYKKAVMQKIFSQKLRFKADDGSDFPEWEESKLGEISSNIGYGLNSSATNYDGKHKYIRITDIDEETNKFVPSPLTSPDQIPNPSYQVSEGDILFARTGASVGKSYIYRKGDGELYFAGFLIRFSIRNANPYFVFLQTKRSEYQKWVKIMSMRSGQPGINAEEYKSFEFKLPSLPEQQKIVTFLTSVDRSIENLIQQITHTQTWKKGLLQKMFV